MRPAQAIKTGFSKSFQYSGRASRSEFWWFAALYLVLQFALDFATLNPLTMHIAHKFTALVTLVFFLPGLALCSRRMHDAGSSAIPYLALIVISVTKKLFFLYALRPNAPFGSELTTMALDPTIKSIDFAVSLILVTTLMYWMSRPSTPGPNYYGPNPSEASK
jgi:uncharacterized membrane protein YhaH (DUF805 family)